MRGLKTLQHQAVQDSDPNGMPVGVDSDLPTVGRYCACRFGRPAAWGFPCCLSFEERCKFTERS